MPTRSQITETEWSKKLDQVHLSKRDLNRLLMDYLVVEGYRNAAENFARESGLGPVDVESIESRMSIHNAIQSGNIEDAIERINNLNPEILDSDPSLYFHLQQQRLIELIRQGRIADALIFAQHELAPRGEEHPAFLPDLERTMALLAFDLPPNASMARPTSTSTSKDRDISMPAALGALLDPSQRKRTALAVNAALLTSQSQSPSPKLPALLRMLAWGEDILAERIMAPKIDLVALLECRQPHALVASESEAMAI